jgi:hypothetical protein
MSQNHPHDNIYSILGKLDALTPKETLKESTAPSIKEYARVPAQGSILSGVEAVQARLAEQFANEEKWIQKAIKHPGALTKKAKAAHMGTQAFAKKHAHDSGTTGQQSRLAMTLKGMHEETCNECGMTLEGCGCDHSNIDEGMVDNVKMAWAKILMWVSDKFVGMKPGMKDTQLEIIAQQVQKVDQLMLSKIAGHPREEQLKKQVHFIVTQLKQETTASGFLNTAHKLMKQLATEREKFEEGETTHKNGVTRHTKTDYPGYPTDDHDESDAEERKDGKKGRPRKAQTKKPRVDPSAEKKGRGRPKAEKPVGHNAPKMHDPFGRVKTGVEKKAKGKKVSGKAMSGSKDLDEKTINPYAIGMAASKKKFGFGSKPAHDLPKKVITKGHEIAKKIGIRESILESVNFRRMMDEQHMTLEEMLSCMQEDMLHFKKTGMCSDRLRDMLEVYSHAKKQMADEGQEQYQGLPGKVPDVGPTHAELNPPLTPTTPLGKVGHAFTTGAKKAWDWITDPKGPVEETSLEEELNELARLAGLDEVGRGEYIKQQDAKAEHSGKKEFNTFGQLFHTDKVKEEPLDEIGDTPQGLAAVQKVGQRAQRGLSDHGTGYADSELPNYDKTLAARNRANAIVNRQAVGGNVKEEPEAEFEGAGPMHYAKEKAKQAGKDTFTLGDQEFPVKEAQDLIQMMKIAGLDYSKLQEALAKDQKSYGDTEVDEPEEEPANKPKEEYQSMKASTMGPGEGDSGQKRMYPPHPAGDNGMTEPARKMPIKDGIKESTVELEARLAAEYESIKKVNQ